LIDVNPGVDVPDSYYIDYDPDAVWYSNADGEGSEFGGSEMYDDPGSVAPQGDLDGNGFYNDGAGSEGFEGSDEDVYDDDLAAALRQELADVSDDQGGSDVGDGSGDDEDEEGARSGDDEEDEDLAEKKDKIKQFTGEIKILESTIEKKRNGFTGGNPIMVKRFEETIAGLQADVNTKVSARQNLLAELESIMIAKAKAANPPEPEVPTPVPVSTSDNRFSVAEEDDYDGEEDEAATAPATPTPVLRPSEADNEEDLFGDDDEDSDDEDGEHEKVDSIDNDTQDTSMLFDDGSSSEPEQELDEEMAALLAAELNDIDAPPEIAADDAATLLEISGLTVERPDDDVEMETIMSSAQKPAFGVEGGVGMRRLATGVLDEGDGSSSDSDDSDD
jgi:transcription initiation factor TFIID subunit 7